MTEPEIWKEEVDADVDVDADAEAEEIFAFFCFFPIFSGLPFEISESGSFDNFE